MSIVYVAQAFYGAEISPPSSAEDPYEFSEDLAFEYGLSMISLGNACYGSQQYFMVAGEPVSVEECGAASVDKDPPAEQIKRLKKALDENRSVVGTCGWKVGLTSY